MAAKIVNIALNVRNARIVNIAKKQSIVLRHLDAKLFTIVVIVMVAMNVIIVKTVTYVRNVKTVISCLIVIDVNNAYSVMLMTHAVSVKDARVAP